MYVLYRKTENRSFVVLGPIPWRPRMLSRAASEELGYDVTISSSDVSKVPFAISSELFINPVVKRAPEYNPLTKKLTGPIWDHLTEVSYENWIVEDRDLDEIKGSLKSEATNQRWIRQQLGKDIIVQGATLQVSLSADTKNQFIQKMLTMTNDTSVQWKFQEGWYTLTKTDLESIVQQIESYIQELFDGEKAKHEEIDACSTVEELLAIEIPDFSETLV